MAAQPHEPPARDALHEAFLHLEVLPGLKAELVDGEIIVSPPPDGQHEKIVVAVDDWVRERGLRLHRNLTLVSPEGEYVPDGIAAPKGSFDGAEWRFAADDVVLILEVTSRRPKPAERDRVAKRFGYAAAGVPLYLLIDRDEHAVTIFSDPRGDDYHHSASAKLGEELSIPPPLNGSIDTADFA